MKKPMEQDGSEFNLGAHIKHLRRKKRWTLETLGEASGLSISALSKIENAQVSTSFDTVVKIAHGLGMPVAELFESTEHNSAPGVEAPKHYTARRVSTRRGEGQPFASDYYDYEVHSSELLHKGMIPLVMTIRTREVPPRANWSVHDGEEFIFVVSGELELHTSLYSPLVLKAGDSAYIDSTMGHAFVSRSEDDAVMLSVCLTERLQFNDEVVGRDGGR
ncbi:XRE family transcriptional regulator [Mesorhizobium sp. M2E.F.Ca.ET.209.01.1.1]|uniref:helix-turn-helix domain-containing protein n=1 Tax=Mesorhizobium sp. M2E.F.Ca.ET.209.01.1.1 TaxID=2500526 RepID=UPI000FD99C7C|nr:XRE family transcriptional regulator [Mesorhizobium sp. M2E.F.Ca.ET.209.01.1.1]TGS14278.1 XRE family transcriptional regulator [Mesorhizobium sp. M2E.F.Ca.ET.209.01.1.1]